MNLSPEDITRLAKMVSDIATAQMNHLGKQLHEEIEQHVSYEVRAKDLSVKVELKRRAKKA